jgi:hypothetical protein
MARESPKYSIESLIAFIWTRIEPGPDEIIICATRSGPRPSYVSVSLLTRAPKLRDPCPSTALLQQNMLLRLVQAVKHISGLTLLLLHAPRFVLFASSV